MPVKWWTINTGAITMSKDFGIQLIDCNDNGDIMGVKIDVQKDASGKIVSGLVLGNTLEQNKACILLARPGDYKFHPTLGVAVKDALLDTVTDLTDFRHKIREEFSKDGLKVRKLDFYTKNKLAIDADYQ